MNIAFTFTKQLAIRRLTLRRSIFARLKTSQLRRALPKLKFSPDFRAAAQSPSGSKHLLLRRVELIILKRTIVFGTEKLVSVGHEDKHILVLFYI